MRTFTRTATCAAALLVGGAAQADVTAQQVWDNWQESLALYGDEGITVGSEEMVGSGLKVTDLMIMTDDGETEVSVTIPSIEFTERGDGTVSVVMSESYPITITGAPGEMAIITVTQSGLEMIVSGDDTEMTYDFTASKIGLELTEFRDRDATVPAEALFNLNSVSGSYTTSNLDLNVITYDMDVGGVDILVDVTEEIDGLTFNFSGQIADVNFSGEIGVPPDSDLDTPEAMFNNGLYLDAGYNFGNSAFLLSFVDGLDSGTGSATIGAAEQAISLDYDGIDYSNFISGINMSFNGSGLPFQVDVSIGEYGLSFGMPLSQSDGPQPFLASFSLADLAISDSIWSMFDPGNLLPRDPATLIVALSGSGSLFYDLLDPAQAMEMADAPVPGALNSLTLDELTVQIAGAEVLGEGGFTFDNNDTTTFPGFPRPEGVLNIAVNGANGLMDKLVRMGLLPEDQVMGARMMMGAFAAPAGEDMLTSTIEINDQGHVIANGQRLQ